jgi:hypothetical protein
MKLLIDVAGERYGDTADDMFQSRRD